MEHKTLLSTLQKTCHLDIEQCSLLLTTMQRLMVDVALEKNDVTLEGLGTFVAHKHLEYTHKDPTTGAVTLYPPRISFRLNPSES